MFLGLKLDGILDFGQKDVQDFNLFHFFFAEMSSVINLGPNKILVGGLPDITPIPPTPINK